MAYVVARPKGRFEIRESVHTPKGPRARSLANFATLTDDVLERAQQRATRPFDREAVRESARRAATPDRAEHPVGATTGGTATVPRHEQPATRHFVEAARRMVKSLERLPEPADRRDPGDAFIDLIGVVAQVKTFGPARPREPLRFPLGRSEVPPTRARRHRRSDRDGRVTEIGQGSQYGDLFPKIVSLHEMLDSAGVPFQFGGAIALIWYRDPRATTDIDINVTLPPEAAGPVLDLFSQLGVSVTPEERDDIAFNGQARLDWDGTCLDVFFATLAFHLDIAEHARMVHFGPIDIPILAPEHLIVCKAIYDRPKDWLDIEEMVRWGTEIDVRRTLYWVADILGPAAPQYTRLAQVLAG